MVTLSAELTFYIPHANSLKDKRTVARGLIEKTRQKYNAAIAETTTQDAHQTLTVGVAVVSGEFSHAVNMLDDIIRFMERIADAELISMVKD